MCMLLESFLRISPLAAFLLWLCAFPHLFPRFFNIEVSMVMFSPQLHVEYFQRLPRKSRRVNKHAHINFHLLSRPECVCLCAFVWVLSLTHSFSQFKRFISLYFDCDFNLHSMVFHFPFGCWLAADA